MTANLKILLVFPKYYPYTKYEVFLETELEVLSMYFDKIYVFPRVHSPILRTLQKNIIVIDEFNKENNLINHNFFDKIWLLKVSAIETFSNFSINFIRKFRENYSFLSSKFKETKHLKNVMSNLGISNAMIYSVWFNDWATVLSIAKQKKYINNFVSRAHGYDLFHFRRSENYIPFQYFNIKNVTKVVCISNAGKTYLKERYPKYKNKVLSSYLGVQDKGTNPFPNPETLKIVSVSNINEVKRIHLIIESLKLTTSNISWTHFGDGPLFNEILEKANTLPTNVKYEFKGRVSSDELMDYYKKNPVHSFVFSSSTEGIPVAIQEAISFGIPIIATNVGGVPEIVKPEWGILLKSNFEPVELKNILEKFIDSKFNTIENRSLIKSFWKNTFNAEQNYLHFAKIIENNEGNTNN